MVSKQYGAEMNLVPSKRFHGIFFDVDQEIWRVIITLDGGGETIGESSISEEEAAHMADELTLEMSTGVPKLNFPD